MIHTFSCYTTHFQAVWDGKKKCEIRRFTVLFQAGDALRLFEMDTVGRYTGRFVEADITYVDDPEPATNIGVLSIEVTLKHQQSGEGNELVSLSD